MKSLISLLVFALTASVTCSAGTIKDIYHESQAGCSYTLTPPYSNCDVMGSWTLYDIERIDVSVSQNWIDATLYFNYPGGTSLAPVAVGNSVLLPGDLFFYDPANPSQYKYGVPLVGRPQLTAGSLYSVTGSLLTADNVLNMPTDYYRHNVVVWLGTGNTKVADGTGVNVVDTGLSTAHGQYAVSIHIPRPATSFWNNVVTGGIVGVAFENATCANDVLAGLVVTGVPEPGSMSLFGIGFGLLTGVGLWRRRMKKA